MDDVELFAVDSPVQQSRLARLMLGMLTGDEVLAGSVFQDAIDDPRGETVALQALLMGLTRDVLSASIRAGTTTPQLIRRLRAQVARLEMEK